MGRVPVGQTIVYAYSFVLGNFPTLLGVVWFPTALYSGLMLPYYRFSADALEMSASGQGMAGDMLFFAIYILFVLASFLFVAIVMVGVTRVALGKRTTKTYFYCEIDYTVLRLLAALVFLLGLYVLGSMVVGFFVALVIGILAATAGGPATAALPLVMFAIVLGCFFFGLVRCVFLIGPVSVTRRTKLISEAWQLSRGNFGAIASVLLATIVPVFLLQMATQYAVAPGFMESAFLVGTDVSNDGAAMLRQIRDGLGASILLLLPLWIVFSAALYGLIGAASAFAYRALVPPSENDTAEIFD